MMRDGIAVILLIGLPGMACAATAGQTDLQQAPPAETADDVLVRGHRVLGSAIGGIEPVAVLDSEALKALGVTSMKDVIARLKGLASAPGGGDPVMMLNGHRVSGNEELYSLPYEAIERTEILSEQDAARFGFPPTVRVMNFITRKHFHALSVDESASTTPEGGGTGNNIELGETRIDAGRRLSIIGSYFHRDHILQSQRDIVPDPTVPYAVQGNVVGAGGGSIDPALDALAGRAVTIAAVPVDPAARQSLASYTGSGQAVTDIGPYRTLQSTLDRFRVDGTYARPIGKIDASLNLSAQQDRTIGLNGLAAAAIAVPAGSPALPFTGPVVVDRYFPGVALAQRGTATTLHAGLTLQGGLGRWAWNLTARCDRAVNVTASDIGVPTDALQAAVTAGGDPLQPLDAAEAGQRLVQRSRSATDTLSTHGVANGPLLHLPAGDALVTLTTDYTHSASDLSGSGQAAAATDQSFGRSITTATASVNVPIASANQGVLSAVGQLGVNALVGVSQVSGYGRLATTNVGFNWAPYRWLQLLGSVNQTRTAPPINLLADPVLTTPNVPVFDYLTGNTALVTTLSGGNPALAPERRRISTLSIQVKPFAKKELQLTVDLVDTAIDRQTASLGNVTAPFQAAFPGLFSRDALGNLIGVDLRPVNLSRERERKLHWALTGNATIGHAPPPPAPPVPGKSPPPPPPPQLNVYAFLSGNYRLSDRLELSPGQPLLDLLDGASLTGSGGRPRWDVDGTIGGRYGPVNFGVYGQLQGSTRIRSPLAASDLRFSGRTYLVYYTDLDVHELLKRRWTNRLTINLVADNLLNNRIAVRDRNGDTPNRFQGAYLDPVGRSIIVGLRKLF